MSAFVVKVVFVILGLIFLFVSYNFFFISPLKRYIFVKQNPPPLNRNISRNIENIRKITPTEVKCWELRITRRVLKNFQKV